MIKINKQRALIETVKAFLQALAPYLNDDIRQELLLAHVALMRAVDAAEKDLNEKGIV